MKFVKGERMANSTCYLKTGCGMRQTWWRYARGACDVCTPRIGLAGGGMKALYASRDLGSRKCARAWTARRDLAGCARRLGC